MILFNGVVHVFVRANEYRFSRLSQPVLSIALYDGQSVGLAAINGDPFRAVAGVPRCCRAAKPKMKADAADRL